MIDIIIAIIQPILVLAVAPLFLGIVRKSKAHFQNRDGASVLQPYWALATLLKKDMTIPEWSSWVYHAVPIVVFACAFILALVTPAVGAGYTPDAASNVFFITGLLALGAAFLVMGGMDTGSTFGNMGSSREMTLAAIIEPTLFVSFTTLATLTSSWSLNGIVGSMVFGSWMTALPAAFALLALVYAALLENARYPVDNPATHLELTMVHEAMVLEYSGPYLALLEYASMLKLAVISILIMNIGLPFFMVMPGAPFENFFVACLFFAVKFIVAAFSIAVIETVVVKMRFYRMQEYALYAFLIAVAGFICFIALFR